MKTGSREQSILRRYVGKPCYLYTLDGVFAAEIQVTKEGKPLIKGKHVPQSIVTSWHTVERKMEGDETFYAC